VIPLLIVAVVCAAGLMVEVARFLWLSWLADKRETRLRHETLRSHELLAQARELHGLAPSKETRLLVVLGEAWCDLMAAIRVEDWETAVTFENQIETIEALLTLPEFRVQRMEPKHRDLVSVAQWS
jgi:hypothetical protein